MAHARYVLGTNQYVVVELERTALSADFDDTEWAYEIALVPRADDFDPATADWQGAVYELASGTHTVKALLGAFTVTAGVYRVFVSLTSTENVETPTILEALGKLEIV